VNDLTTLPNIGQKLATLLDTAGIDSPKELSAIGSVEAVLRITGHKPLTGYNMLYAIEGAIRGVRWHSIPKGDLRKLREEYDRKQADG
jgi:DNA transformation protein